MLLKNKILYCALGGIGVYAVACYGWNISVFNSVSFFQAYSIFDLGVLVKLLSGALLMSLGVFGVFCIAGYTQKSPEILRLQEQTSQGPRPGRLNQGGLDSATISAVEVDDDGNTLSVLRRV